MSGIQDDFERGLEMIKDPPPKTTPERVRDAIKAKLPDAIEMGYYCSGEAIDGNDDLILEFNGDGPMIEVRIIEVDHGDDS